MVVDEQKSVRRATVGAQPDQLGQRVTNIFLVCGKLLDAGRRTAGLDGKFEDG